MKKIIILVSIFLLLIGATTYIIIEDINLGSIGILSISGIKEKNIALEKEEEKYSNNKSTFETKEASLNNISNEFTEEKDKYEKITDTTLDIVKDAIKEVDYSVEYMWIVLGNYAYKNGLTIRIEEVQPGTVAQEETTDEKLEDTGDETKKTDNTGTANTGDAANTSETTKTTTTSKDNIKTNTNTSENAQTTLTTSTEKVLKLTVNGRYSDVADFVFEVENDKSLRFKLDNITMKYSSDNKITATFDVYGLTIRK